MLNDPGKYPEPQKFVPERYLDEDGKLKMDDPNDPSEITFGFGRR